MDRVFITHNCYDLSLEIRSPKCFSDEGPNPIETSPLSCSANQWTGFFMIRTSVIKKLRATTIILVTSCHKTTTSILFVLLSWFKSMDSMVYILLNLTITKTSKHTGTMVSGLCVFQVVGTPSLMKQPHQGLW